MTDERFMHLAIEEARRAIAAGQSPFAAVITRGTDLIISAHNLVLATLDSTAHAEVTAIRLACKKLDTIDLSGCTIYSTTEPCPMCFSAIHWARISRIVYGTTIADAAAAGFSELPITNAQMCHLGHSKLLLTPELLRDHCLPLFRDYNGPRY